MANEFLTAAFEPTYSEQRACFCSNYKRTTPEHSRTDAIRFSPLVSLAVKHAIDNSTPQPSNSLADSFSAVTLSKDNVSADTSSGASPFAASDLQKSQWAPASTSTPQASTFGKPSLQFDSNLDSGVLPLTSNVFGASASTPNASFGQAASSQLQSQPSLQNGNTSSQGNANEKENVKPATSPSSLRPQAASFSAGQPGASTDTKITASSNTSNSPFFDFEFEPFGGNKSRESSAPALSFPSSQKSARPIKSIKKPSALPQYGLLGFDLDNCDANDNPEPILLNTNSPTSVFLCGSQGSGKSYTLSCVLENHLLDDPSVGVQRQTIPGFVFHWDTNTSGSLAEAASLCSRGIKVRVLVSWSNYRKMKGLYEDFATKVGGKIEVRPLLFKDHELTVNNIRDLMAFRDVSTNPPLYLEVIQNMLRRLGRQDEKFSVVTFLDDLAAADFSTAQQQMLDQRLSILRTFSAATAEDILKQDNPSLAGKRLARERQAQGLGLERDCITVENGTLTIVDLSDPFVDAGTACVLFDICLGVIIKTHKEAVTANRISPGLIITLDEAHKFLDKNIPSAEIFTNSLLTTIREQRHNAARVIIATQEPTISEKLLDLCSISVVHRFSSPAWFTTLCGHLGGASSLTSENAEDKAAVKKEELFKQIVALQTGESLVFSPTSWVRGGAQPGGGDVVEPARLDSGVLRMKTRKRKGDDAGKTWNVV